MWDSSVNCRLNRGLDCSPRIHVALQPMLVLLHGSIVFITLQLGLYTLYSSLLLYLDLVTSIRTFYKLHSFCNTLGLYHRRLILLKLFCTSLHFAFCIVFCLIALTVVLTQVAS